MSELERRKAEVCSRIDELREPLLAISHAIHAHPELAFGEQRAADLLCEALARAGLAVRRGVHGLDTSFETSLGEVAGPCIALLAEYDALPQIGHSCWHNLIATTSSVRVALAALGDALPGHVRLISTPAEEQGRQRDHGARRGVRRRGCGDDGASSGRRSRDDAVSRAVGSGRGVSRQRRARLLDARARRQRARRAGDRVPVDRCAATTHRPERARARHHHRWRRRAEHRARTRRREVLCARARRPRTRRVEAACRGLLSCRRCRHGRAARSAVARSRLPRATHLLAARRCLSAERRAARAALLSDGEAAAERARQHRHGQRLATRAIDPSDDRRRAAERDHPPPRLRHLGSVLLGDSATRRREGAGT